MQKCVDRRATGEKRKIASDFRKALNARNEWLCGLKDLLRNTKIVTNGTYFVREHKNNG